jgi:hypothetical protein
MIDNKLSLCICWCLVFLYNIVHGHGIHQISKLQFHSPKIAACFLKERTQYVFLFIICCAIKSEKREPDL